MELTPRVPPHSQEAEISVLGSVLLDNDTLAKLVNIGDNADLPDYRSAHIHGLYEVSEGGAGLRRALDEIRTKVSNAIAT